MVKMTQKTSTCLEHQVWHLLHVEYLLSFLPLFWLYQITKIWCNEGRHIQLCLDCIWHNGLKHIFPKCWFENITLNIAGLPRRQFEEVLAKSSANLPSHVPYSAPAKSYSQQNFVSSPSRWVICSAEELD